MEIKGTEMDSIEKYLELSRTFLPSLRNFRWYLTRRNCMHLHKKVAEESELYTRAITI